MYIKMDIDFDFLLENCWGGAISTLETISKYGKEDMLISVLEETFYDDIPTLTEINDLLWFDSDNVYEALDIEPDEEEEEE